MQTPTSTIHEWSWRYKRFSCRAIGSISNEQKKMVIDILTQHMGTPETIAAICNKEIAQNLSQEDVMAGRAPIILVVEEAF